MDRSKHARIYSLVLDPSDKVAAVLIAAIDVYLAIKATEQPKTPNEQYGFRCPYCGTEFGIEEERIANKKRPGQPPMMSDRLAFSAGSAPG